ncbi:MAG: hypothetical protein LBN95_03875 [Prevotellaceae bacterium]|jgi:hypothetical protein|nr:hypothetical protein [Prevotellaceae bacterium]
METIIEKLKKIKTLAEQGFSGEMQAAKITLERLLKKYNLTVEDLSNEVKKQRYFIAKIENDRVLLILCSYKIIGLRTSELYNYKGEPNKFYIDLTDYEFAEFSELLYWHKINMKKEFNQFVIDFRKAYQYKHNLYCSDKIPEDREQKLSLGEIERIIKISSEMQDVKYLKAIEQ